MMKLNSKGMTTIEILVTFVLVVILTVSMYGTVSSYKSKQQIESYKEKIYTYKNLLTKEIQDDLIKRRVTSADIENNDDTKLHKYTTTIKLHFADNSTKNLVIYRQLARDYDYDSGLDNWDAGTEKQNDEFWMSYGGIKYPIPSLGFGKNDFDGTVQDLRIQNVDVSTKGGVFTLRVDFYHVDLDNRYGVRIVCPLNFY